MRRYHRCTDGNTCHNNWEDGVLYIGKYLIDSDYDISGDYTIKSGTLTIADQAFNNRMSLTGIVIPDSVVSIGRDTFEYCEGLKSVTIGNGVTSIGEFAFSNCGNLTSLTIGNGVTTIYCYAFSRCNSLKSVVLPDSITTIEYYAFRNCESLTSIVIGKGVTTIEWSAFAECTSLTSVYYKGIDEEWRGIDISSQGNAYLTSATLYYYSETEPTTDGNFWHFDADGIIPIVWNKQN